VTTFNLVQPARTLVAGFGFHDVADDPTTSGFQRRGAAPYKLGTAAFQAQLDRLASAPVQPGLVTDIDLTVPGRHLLLTFDDGGKSALAIGEELCRRGWRGHFFISTGLIGRRTFLTGHEIRQLRNQGHVVGSHSHTHPNIYRELPWEVMVVEWRRSCDILEQLLGEPCTVGAVPGGEISAAVLRSAPAAGLRHVFTSEPSLRPRIVGGCWVLGRFCVKSSVNPDQVAELANFRGWAGKLLSRRLKNAACRSLPSLYRLYVSRSVRQWQEAT
jgi:peptidoglycan/xylan/chitin deacetylase (PgdA/CDA1 family)